MTARTEGVIGAEVRRSSDGKVVGYTGVDGYLAVDQASGTTDTYYVNTTDTDAYESEIDFMTEPVEVPAYVPVATATEAEFADGTSSTTRSTPTATSPCRSSTAGATRSPRRRR